MNKINQLQSSLQSHYTKSTINELLNSTFGSRVSFKPNPVDISVGFTELQTSIIKSVNEYGNIQTDDGNKIKCVEVVLQQNVSIEQYRIIIRQFISKLTDNSEIALVNLVSADNSSWKLILVVNEPYTDGRINSKLFTYNLGLNENCKLLLDRLIKLSSSTEINIESFKNLFSIDDFKKSFLDEYVQHYHRFYNSFKQSDIPESVFNINVPTGASSDEIELAYKPIRDFTGKLLSGIVLLYFVQKKGWLGASDTNYKDGLSDFVKKLFEQSGGGDKFYSEWLSVLFYDTISTQRVDDAFRMPDGKIVKVPFLNEGIFNKKEYNHSKLRIDPKLFYNPDYVNVQLKKNTTSGSRGFLDFLESYNLSIHETSPNDEIIAIDGEMLGNVFENLLEDNKDKGAFYTPKEIVHYMCRESLIQYLTTKLNIEDDSIKSAISNLIINKVIDIEIKSYLPDIEELLKVITICDPAVGSGAFPMGMLHEIHTVRELIAHELNLEWNPYSVKEHIIANNIYGVDIESGAVDIAYMRFWLSLLVDMKTPIPLPNLDYRIVVGNSLVPMVCGEIVDIDWDLSKDTKFSFFDTEGGIDVPATLKKIEQKKKEYFNSPRRTELDAEIRNLKIDVLLNQLELMILKKGIDKKPTEHSKRDKSQMELWEQTKTWKRTVDKLKQLRNG
jgi:hypothetical protein